MENHIESVVLLIGSSVLNPLTVFNISVPELSYSHCEKQHSSRQHIDNVFRWVIIIMYIILLYILQRIVYKMYEYLKIKLNKKYTKSLIKIDH